MYSKSGCKTCKIRKVKCDETYPACRRCLSTGRRCDGYNGVPPSGLHRPVPTAVRAAMYADMSVQERQDFELFGLRTARKLPATCQTEFWSKLILQASHSQPAVLHASLALGALHREILFSDPSPRKTESAPCFVRLEEQYASRLSVNHYLKALRHLRAHASTMDDIVPANSDGVALQALLIACILFISLECMRGHLVAAHTHIQRGLAILTSTALPVDSWIQEAFARMELQFVLWTMSASNHLGYSPKRSILDTDALSQSRTFGSLKIAWSVLGDIIIQAIHLTRICYDSKTHETFTQEQSEFRKTQKALLRVLRRWLTRFESMLKNPPTHQNLGPSRDGAKAGLILYVYHDMATIITELSLCAGDEMSSDTQLPRFTSMLRLLKDLYQVDQTKPDLRHFIMDLGCLAPLHYIATKCRDHAIRWQAIEMLEAVSHREGIWDAQITAAATRAIVEEEEGALFGQGAKGVLVPASRRISRFNILLTGSPVESISILPCTI